MFFIPEKYRFRFIVAHDCHYVIKQLLHSIFSIFCEKGKNRGIAESTKPVYGCQVTIQSEMEKQIMKIYRKEEKKERKREKRGDEGESWESTFHLDPVELRLHR